MFNARSARDHLACALAPTRQRTPKVMHATQSPIFTVDVDDGIGSSKCGSDTRPTY